MKKLFLFVFFLSLFNLMTVISNDKVKFGQCREAFAIMVSGIPSFKECEKSKNKECFNVFARYVNYLASECSKHNIPHVKVAEQRIPPKMLKYILTGNMHGEYTDEEYCSEYIRFHEMLEGIEYTKEERDNKVKDAINEYKEIQQKKMKKYFIKERSF